MLLTEKLFCTFISLLFWVGLLKFDVKSSSITFICFFFFAGMTEFTTGFSSLAKYSLDKIELEFIMLAASNVKSLLKLLSPNVESDPDYNNWSKLRCLGGKFM